MMKSIKFSHDYNKLPTVWEGTQARLLAVVPYKTTHIRNALTAFYKKDITYRGEQGQYDLNFEDALVLIFLHYNTGDLFSTIRRDYPSKREYYTKAIGETFILERTQQ